jgi:hypothetical protein
MSAHEFTEFELADPFASPLPLIPTNVFMIDIETLGLESGSAILEVAAAEFDPATGEVLREWEGRIDLLDSIRLGLRVDAETAEFHLRKNYQGTLRGSTNHRVLSGLDEFLHARSEDVSVWAWGKDFEAKHFECVLGRLGFQPLWDFRKLHCARDSWILRFGQDKPRPRRHTAAEDVRDQIRDLCQALRKP